MPLISVVSPIFNEEECLPEFCRRVTAVLGEITGDFEIILVDDGSRDRSWSIISSLSAADTRIRGYRFSRNFGHHFAIAAGLDQCTGDWVVVMDSDLQDPPEAIPLLYAKALEGYEIVIVNRVNRQFSWVKNFLAKMFHTVFKYLADIKHQTGAGVFRIMSRRVVDAVCQLRESFLYFPGIVDWVGFQRTQIEHPHGQRFAGETKYPLVKQLSLAFNTIINFSDKPLLLIVYVGVAVFSSSFLLAGYIIFRRIFGSIAVQGWSSIVVIILLIGGLTISTLGVVGLYVARIFRQVRQRPLYIIGDRTESAAKRELSSGGKSAAEL